MSSIPMRMILLVAALFSVIAVCVTILSAMGKDPTALIGISVSIFVPSLISLITLGQVADVKKDVGDVKTQTNGHLTAALAAAGIPPVETTESGKP